VALTVHVFHLISNWQQALAEIRRVLKSGGIYLYSHGYMDNNSFDFEQKLQAIMAEYGFDLDGTRSRSQAWYYSLYPVCSI